MPYGKPVKRSKRRRKAKKLYNLRITARVKSNDKNVQVNNTSLPHRETGDQDFTRCVKSAQENENVLIKLDFNCNNEKKKYSLSDANYEHHQRGRFMSFVTLVSSSLTRKELSPDIKLRKAHSHDRLFQQKQKFCQVLPTRSQDNGDTSRDQLLLRSSRLNRTRSLGSVGQQNVYKEGCFINPTKTSDEESFKSSHSSIDSIKPSEEESVKYSHSSVDSIKPSEEESVKYSHSFIDSIKSSEEESVKASHSSIDSIKTSEEESVQASHSFIDSIKASEEENAKYSHSSIDPIKPSEEESVKASHSSIDSIKSSEEESVKASHYFIDSIKPSEEELVQSSKSSSVSSQQICERASDLSLSKCSADLITLSENVVSESVLLTVDIKDSQNSIKENQKCLIAEHSVIRREIINWPFIVSVSFIFKILKWVADQGVTSLKKIFSLLRLKPLVVEANHCKCCHNHCGSELLQRLEAVEKELSHLKNEFSAGISARIQNLSIQGPPPPPPLPPPPPPPPPLPSAPIFPVSKSLISSKNNKGKQKMNNVSIRPSITVEDLRRVQLRKTPAGSLHKCERDPVTPKGPVVSLEMLRSVKLKSSIQRRIGWEKRKAVRDENGLRIKSPSQSPRENPFTWALRRKDSNSRFRGKNALSSKVAIQLTDALSLEV